MPMTSLCQGSHSKGQFTMGKKYFVLWCTFDSVSPVLLATVAKLAWERDIFSLPSRRCYCAASLKRKLAAEIFLSHKSNLLSMKFYTGFVFIN